MGLYEVRESIPHQLTSCVERQRVCSTLEKYSSQDYDEWCVSTRSRSRTWEVTSIVHQRLSRCYIPPLNFVVNTRRRGTSSLQRAWRVCEDSVTVHCGEYPKPAARGRGSPVTCRRLTLRVHREEGAVCHAPLVLFTEQLWQSGPPGSGCCTGLIMELSLLGPLSWKSDRKNVERKRN